MTAIANYQVRDSNIVVTDWDNRVVYQEYSVPKADLAIQLASLPLGTFVSGGSVTSACTGVYGGALPGGSGQTTVTSATAQFTPEMVGASLVIGASSFVIVTVTSATVCVVTGDASAGGTYTIAAGGLTWPKLYRIRSAPNRPGMDGRSTIQCWFKRPVYRWPDTIQSVRGSVIRQRYLEKSYEIRDRAGSPQQITGPSVVAADCRTGTYYRVVGVTDSFVLRPRGRIVIEAMATTAYDTGVVDALVGKTNAATCLGKSAGTLLFAGATETTTYYWEEASVREIRFEFLYNPDVWQGQVKIQGYQRILTEDLVYDTSGASTSKKMVAVRDVPTGSELTATIYSTGDFTNFDNMVNL